MHEAGAVEQHIKGRASERRRHGGTVTHVQLGGGNARRLCRQAGEGGRIDIGCHHAGAFVGKGQRGCPPDPCACRRDQGALACQSIHVKSFQF